MTVRVDTVADWPFPRASVTTSLTLSTWREASNFLPCPFSEILTV